MSYNHTVILTINGNNEHEITLSKSDRNLYDYSIKKIEGFYGYDVIDLFNYIVNTYIISSEKISNWLKGGIDIDDFDYLDTQFTNHKVLLQTLKLCTELKFDIGCDVISKIISESILKTPMNDIDRLVSINL